jgi:starch phosphorylase
LLTRADCCIPDTAIWEAHVQAKQHLIEKVQALTGVALQPNIPIFGFARRMTAYKRPDLLFSDLAVAGDCTQPPVPDRARRQGASAR